MSEIVLTLIERREVQVLVESPTIYSAIEYLNKYYAEGNLVVGVEDVQGSKIRVVTDASPETMELLKSSGHSYLIDNGEAEPYSEFLFTQLYISNNINNCEDTPYDGLFSEIGLVFDKWLESAEYKDESISEYDAMMKYLKGEIK